MSAPAQTMTVNQVMHALDNSTPYPVELTSDVLRYMAERMLEMTEMRKKTSHEVWQFDRRKNSRLGHHVGGLGQCLIG